MSRDRNLQQLIIDTLLQSNMAATLSHHGPAIPLQGLDYSATGEAGHLAHNWIS